MDNYFIFNLCQYILNEEQSGNALPPDEFNRLMRVCSLELTRQVFKVYEEGQDVTDALERFKSREFLTFEEGVADLPEDYRKVSFMLGSIPGSGEDEAESSKSWVDFVSDYEWGERQITYITRPTIYHPIARVVDETLEILPITITNGEFHYLRIPDTPFMDYYYSSDGRIVYFPEGTHDLSDGEQSRDGEEDITIISENVELDWNEPEQLIIVGMICSKAGANLKEAQIVEYSELLKTQAS